MYKLLFFDDFPKCKNYKPVASDSNKQNLINHCIELLKKKEYCKPETMLCIMDGEQVVHPVISDLKGGTTHPKKDGWVWFSGNRYTVEERKENHNEFSKKLKSHMAGMSLPEDKTLVEKKTAVVDNVSPQKKSKYSSSLAVKQKKEKKQKEQNETSAISLEESKKIINDNFNKLLDAYRQKYTRDFFESEDFKMFFPSREEYDKIIEWNKNAEKRDDLIDITGFYELYLGNPENADIVVLGVNPGASGLDKQKSDDEIKSILQEMEQRKEGKDIFYPLSSLQAMRRRPWFPGRLIFGRGVSVQLPNENTPKQGILSEFIVNTSEACKYAGRICSIELVPYHTPDFNNGKNLIKEFGMIECILAPVRNAMNKGKIILLPYGTTRNSWLLYLPELKNYEFAYTTHKKYGQNKAEANGSLNIEKLRLLKNIDTPRTEDENCDALFDRLVELEWKKI